MLGVCVSLCECLLKCTSFLFVILVLLLEFSDFILLSYNIVFVCSTGKDFSIFDISYFLCLWLLRLAPFCFLLCYVIADVYRTEKKSRNYLKTFLALQFMCLIKTLLVIAARLWFNHSNTDMITEDGDQWLLFINSYSLLFYYFDQTRRPILMGYLIQLGLNGCVFEITFFQYLKFRLKSNRHKETAVAIAITGIDLVKFQNESLKLVM